MHRVYGASALKATFLFRKDGEKPFQKASTLLTCGFSKGFRRNKKRALHTYHKLPKLYKLGEAAYLFAFQKKHCACHAAHITSYYNWNKKKAHDEVGGDEFRIYIVIIRSSYSHTRDGDSLALI